MRRDRLKIYGDLLSALYSSGEKIVITRVQSKINVPFDRLKKYIEELTELGLIQDETSMKITEKGKRYLTEYKTVVEFLKSMGLSYEK